MAVKFTHLDKPLFPADGITKGDLIAYYQAVAPYILPYLRDRPINLQRFPNGIASPGFYQQAMPRHYPDWIASVEVKKEGGRVRHVVARDAATLIYLANQNCITLHAWLSRAPRLRHPDQMIFDLDPSDDGTGMVRDSARALGALLRERGLPPFLKTSGARGYHVLVPLDGKTPYDAVRAFAHDMAEQLAQRHPTWVTTAVRKRARRGRVYVDTLRNAYAHTAVAPFTVRARAGAPVATPIAWEELEDAAMRPTRFTIHTIQSRLDAGIDPWRDLNRRAVSLAKYI